MNKALRLLTLLEWVGAGKFEPVTQDNWGHLEIGDHLMSYRGVSNLKVEFIGWFDDRTKEELDPNEENAEHVLLRFKEPDGTEFDCYFHAGKFCVGSSADPIKVKAI